MVTTYKVLRLEPDAEGEVNRGRTELRQFVVIITDGQGLLELDPNDAIVRLVVVRVRLSVHDRKAASVVLDMESRPSLNCQILPSLDCYGCSSSAPDVVHMRPFCFLDLRKRLLKYLRGIRGRPVTLLIVTHRRRLWKEACSAHLSMHGVPVESTDTSVRKAAWSQPALAPLTWSVA